MSKSNSSRRGMAPLELVMVLPVHVALLAAILYLGMAIHRQLELANRVRSELWQTRFSGSMNDFAPYDLQKLQGDLSLSDTQTLKTGLYLDKWWNHELSSSHILFDGTWSMADSGASSSASVVVPSETQWAASLAPPLEEPIRASNKAVYRTVKYTTESEVPCANVVTGNPKTAGQTSSPQTHKDQKEEINSLEHMIDTGGDIGGQVTGQIIKNIESSQSSDKEKGKKEDVKRMDLACFAIYDENIDENTKNNEIKDKAFKRAAETAIAESKEKYGDKIKTFIYSYSTTDEFIKVWNDIHNESTKDGYVIIRGDVFSHGSYEGKATKSFGIGCKGINNGKGEGKDNVIGSGTIGVSVETYLPVLMDQLQKMPWAKDAYLHLHGCNSGNTEPNGRCIAQFFADQQQVKTFGEKGYADFSRRKNSHGWWAIDFDWKWLKKIGIKIPTIPLSEKVYLHAYRRGKNSIRLKFPNDGSRIDPLECTPTSVKQ